jgi:1-deoxy-D-xylulose-5-phosphate reductoisomerase
MTDSASPRGLAILGSTGSIGRNCLEIVAAHPTRFRVVALSGHRNLELLRRQVETFRPKYVILTDGQSTDEIGGFPASTQALRGDEGIRRAVEDPELDLTVGAIVGSAGLSGALATVEAGKPLALANKETLVVAGSIVMRTAKRTGATILPVDSEHSAVFQAALAGRASEIKKAILTASGGPFRDLPAASFRDVTPEQALAHPNWNMGAKVTIDSATMMNKALETIEAKWLFDLTVDQIAVTVHPQSIVHSLVEFCDGSVIAQLSHPDMRLPIQYALGYPERLPGCVRPIDWTDVLRLDFRPPDREKFPSLALGEEVLRLGGTTGVVLNAANETAVAAFLDRRLTFDRIPAVSRAILDVHHYEAEPTLETLTALDAWARAEAAKWICS